jgi:hypothetical protein
MEHAGLDLRKTGIRRLVPLEFTVMSLTYYYKSDIIYDKLYKRGELW